MRVVVDTNVLLAAAISEGPPFDIVNMAFGRQIAQSMTQGVLDGG